MLKILVLLCACALLSGCATFTKTFLPDHRFVGTFESTPMLNTDVNNTPAPLYVQVFQLKSNQAFNSATYQQLANMPEKALGDALVAKQDLTLVPNNKVSLEMRVKPGVKYIGVVAAFYNLTGNAWRQTIALEDNWGHEDDTLIFGKNSIKRGA